MIIFTSNVYASTTEDVFMDAVDDLSVEINNILNTNNTSAHDCIQIGNIFYCSDCPFQGKNLIIGNKLSMNGGENDDDEKTN